MPLRAGWWRVDGVRGVKWLVGLVVFSVVALSLGLVVLSGGSGSAAGAQGAVGVVELSQLSTAICPVNGQVPGLTASQSRNAEDVVALAMKDALGDPGAIVGVMTALTESSLNNDLPTAADGGAAGIFQQTAAEGWGTVAEEEDPVAASRMFFARLSKVPGWQTMPPWEAAQAVQRSGAGRATDGAANYEPHLAEAVVVVAAVDRLASGPGSACGEGAAGAMPAGPASSFGLPVGYQIPSAATPAETLAVSYAVAQLGKGYVWGAAGPGSFDCSGLTMMAWASAGYRLAHYTGDQLSEGTAVASVAFASPGDLILVPGSDGTLAAPGHVGIYLGYGLVESAVDPAQGIIVQSWANFTAGGLSGIRHVA